MQVNLCFMGYVIKGLEIVMSKLINVIGLGYIGLPTALMMASKGLRIVGTDYDKQKIENLQRGNLTFEEVGLKELYQEACRNGIEFTEEYKEADFYIIAVPTPFDKKSKKVIADYLVHATENIIDKCRNETIIVVESTVSPGTIDRFVRPIVEQKNKEQNKTIHISHAPERIIPGKMIGELLHNNRTIGADSLEIAEKVKKIYASFCKGDIVLTDIKTAEMSKVVENAYRDINSAYANELVKICNEVNIDVYELIRIANKHPRVNVLMPGPGVGGHCISVDPWFLVGDYPGLANIILAARKINDSMPEYVLQRISEIMEEKGIEKVSRVGIYGITYKENVDDIRESPTLQLLECMKKHLAKGIKLYDPFVKKDIAENQYHDFETFISEIDLLVIMVGHDEIKEKYEQIKHLIIFDTRNIFWSDSIFKL